MDNLVILLLFKKLLNSHIYLTASIRIQKSSLELRDFLHAVPHGISDSGHSGQVTSSPWECNSLDYSRSIMLWLHFIWHCITEKYNNLWTSFLSFFFFWLSFFLSDIINASYIQVSYYFIFNISEHMKKYTKGQHIKESQGENSYRNIIEK